MHLIEQERARDLHICRCHDWRDAGCFAQERSSCPLRGWIEPMTGIQRGRLCFNAGSVVIALPALLVACVASWIGANAEGLPRSGIAVSGQELRIGAWNIEDLGHGNSKDFDVVASVIERHFDVIAIVEVMQRSGTHPGYDKLLDRLGSHWNGLITKTPRPNIRSGSNSGNAEYYAIMFRKNRIAVCDGWERLGLVYHKDGDGSKEEGNGIFDREPAFACLQAKRGGAKSGFDFVLAAYHARWGKNYGDERRRNAVKTLPEVFEAMGNARPGERDLIIAGDFNLSPKDMKKEFGNCPKMFHMGQLLDCGEPASEHKVSGSTLNGSGERVNIYDYILVHDAEETSEMVRLPEILDVRGIVADHRTFVDSVSDHLPVVALFETNRVDDD